MTKLLLALRMLRRDYRSGELTILLLALIIAVTSSSTISLFADRLQRTMTDQASEFLAADLVITSPTLIPAEWLQRAEQLGLLHSQSAEFSSVLIENDQLLLAGIKAVSNQYPLRGHLKTIQTDYTTEQTYHHGPAANTVWVEKRILSALGFKLGDTLHVGEKALLISELLTYEPDKRGDLYSLSPRVMMNDQDLAATQIIQPGSHIHYFFHFAGETKALAQFKASIKAHLNPSQRIMDIHEDRPEVGSAITRAERYLGLSSILVILIAGVAIAMSTRRYTERHFDTTAILRCLGCTEREIIVLFSYQILLIGLFACVIGCLIGWFAQTLLLSLLQNLLPAKIAAPSLLALLLGFLTGMIILISFTLPPLLSLKKVPALRVLRRELQPPPASAWFVYGLSASMICLLIWRYTNDISLTGTIIGSGFVCLLILNQLVKMLFTLLKTQLPHYSLYWRLSLQNLIQERHTSIAQILAFSITLTAMILTFTVKTDMVDAWKQQLPENAPNNFALNISEDQLSATQLDLAALTGTSSAFYPVVSGRLVRINDQPVHQRVSKESRGNEAIERDLSLTWAENLPANNLLMAGAWWNSDTQNAVSVEQKLAENLGIKLGDILTFTVGSEQFTAQVSSFRKVDWETMQPNFYMILTPSTLASFPHTYMTSFYLAADKKNHFNQFLKKYSNVMILEVDLILAQFKMILAQITEAMNYLFYLAFAAGFTVLFAAIYSTLDQRIYKGALMRTLGANRRLLNTIHLFEYALLGLLSGLLAIVLSEAVLFCLYRYALHLEYRVNFLIWLIVPLCATGMISLTGFFALRRVTEQAPLQVLQQL